jgi:flagellin
MNAMLATNNMTKNTALAGNAMEKLSSGLRINKAGDDAAGLAISEKMRSQIRGMEQADKNVQDGVSLAQTAEGALEESGNILQRMRELTVQGGNDTLVTEDRAKIEGELKQLGQELDKIAVETKFNGQTLLSSATTTITIQAGANAETRTITISSLKTIATSVANLTVADNATAKASQVKIDKALEDVNKGRANLGAMQNRLEATSSNLTTSTENLTAAESRIRDVDVAKEMVNLSKLNLLTQASQAMVGQAKQQPEGVMQLLR